ncbi:MAG TPA: hypothetical protein VIL55_02340 [Naasia sp.]
MRLTSSDIGAWLVTCNPREFAEMLPRLRAGERVDGWCVRPTYRLDLIAPDQPALLLVSGPRGATPEPGIWMRGRMTGELDHGGHRPRAGLALALLDAPLPREVLRADPRTARMEVLRSAQTSNPSVVLPAEWAAIEGLLAGGVVGAPAGPGGSRRA